MKAISSNYSEWAPRQEDLEHIYDERLSYRAVFRQKGAAIPGMSATPSGERYAKVILLVERDNRITEFDQVVRRLRATYDHEMKRLGLNSSPWGNDNSWIAWDVAKQLYYLFTRDQSTNNVRYRLADPLTDEQICDEIVCRHIGWEFCDSGIREPWASHADVRRLLGPECKSSVHQDLPASWALARLGAIIRSSH